MSSLVDAYRRARSRWDGEIRTLPILALSVHSACNCRCVMCDIWRANADKRELSADELDTHVAAIRRLHVQRVMLTGGEPLLHSNLWTLCGRLRTEGIRLTLVTTGLLIDRHAPEIARTIDEVVVSIDGPPDAHDAIRRVRGGFARIARGLSLLSREVRRPHVIARCVVQHANHAVVPEMVAAIEGIDVDTLSFLAADVSSTAFNRADGWDASRQAEVAVGVDRLPALTAGIRTVASRLDRDLDPAFIAGGVASLWRIHAYYRALANLGAFPRVRCNAPWISAVLEPGGMLRPCFFHAPYRGGTGLDALNSAEAVAFRRGLDVTTNDTCRTCVCSLSLPLLARG
jgi:Fe-coproporphyrin III synthase